MKSDGATVVAWKGDNAPDRALRAGRIRAITTTFVLEAALGGLTLFAIVKYDAEVNSASDSDWQQPGVGWGVFAFTCVSLMLVILLISVVAVMRRRTVSRLLRGDRVAHRAVISAARSGPFRRAFSSGYAVVTLEGADHLVRWVVGHELESMTVGTEVVVEIRDDAALVARPDGSSWGLGNVRDRAYKGAAASKPLTKEEVEQRWKSLALHSGRHLIWSRANLVTGPTGTTIARFSRPSRWSLRQIVLDSEEFGTQECALSSTGPWAFEQTYSDCLSGMPVVRVEGGSHKDRAERAVVIRSDGSRIMLPVSGKSKSNAVLAGRDTDGRELFWLRFQRKASGRRASGTIDVFVAPDQDLSLELLWVLWVAISNLRSYFQTSGSGA